MIQNHEALELIEAHFGSLSGFRDTRGNQQLTIDVTNWYNGTNSVVFGFKGEIYVENLIKQ